MTNFIDLIDSNGEEWTRTNRYIEACKQIETLTAQVGVLREAKEALGLALLKGTNNICSHDETYRGGAIWEICRQCGEKWADDEGGKPEFKWPEWVLRTEKAIATIQSALGEEK